MYADHELSASVVGPEILCQSNALISGCSSLGVAHVIGYHFPRVPIYTVQGPLPVPDSMIHHEPLEWDDIELP
jgi:hypothetical protein